MFRRAYLVLSDLIPVLCPPTLQAYVNMALFENFTYAGIDATAEEA